MISCDNITIRAVNTDDIDTIYGWNNQSERGNFQEFNFTSKDSLKKQLQNGELFSENFQMLMIESPVGSPAGLVYLSFVRAGMVRLGIVISSTSRSSGIGKAVTLKITEYIFDNFPVVRIEADTDIDNIAAQKVLIQSGFTQEGVLKKYRFHHGRYRDFILFSKIRDL
ncbi:MAG: GNAT family N-acetyltransferase [Defluviitaleaceae bacterium]|nr:GNAT family N-acetyltransferase [Defluviitaleaceae bacterium]